VGEGDDLDKGDVMGEELVSTQRKRRETRSSQRSRDTMNEDLLASEFHPFLLCVLPFLASVISVSNEPPPTVPLSLATGPLAHARRDRRGA